MRVRVGHLEDQTLAEGPGARLALWAQGCTLRCPGCCNPHLFAAAGGAEWEVEALLARAAALRGQVEGVTLLGGEPFEQAEALAAFARGSRALGLTVMTFTGYALEELVAPGAEAALPGARALLEATDLLVDGRYDAARPERVRRWAGSENQRFHFLTAAYAPGVERAPPGEPDELVEVRLAPDGGVRVNGWPALGRRGR